ncbi:hypothetical protein GF338_10840 [candidate division WOR-3 bacterium]|nr:hypothetical protein [candidate division WOR-3 bacterium]
MSRKQAALLERVSEELATETGELDSIKERLTEEVLNFETSYFLRGENGGYRALVKQYRKNKERIRLLLREKLITPDEAARLLSALNLVKNRCC